MALLEIEGEDSARALSMNKQIIKTFTSMKQRQRIKRLRLFSLKYCGVSVEWQHEISCPCTDCMERKGEWLHDNITSVVVVVVVWAGRGMQIPRSTMIIIVRWRRGLVLFSFGVSAALVVCVCIHIFYIFS